MSFGGKLLLALLLAACIGIASATPASDARAAARPAMAAYRTVHPTCEWLACSDADGTPLTNPLNVHHIIPCASDPALASSTNNMITLCRRHHLALGHAGDGACRRYVENLREWMAGAVVRTNYTGKVR